MTERLFLDWAFTDATWRGACCFTSFFLSFFLPSIVGLYSRALRPISSWLLLLLKRTSSTGTTPNNCYPCPPKARAPLARNIALPCDW